MRFDNPFEQETWNRHNPRPGEVEQEAYAAAHLRRLRKVREAILAPASAARAAQGWRHSPTDQLAAASRNVADKVEEDRWNAWMWGRKRGEWLGWGFVGNLAPLRKGCNVRRKPGRLA